MFSIAYSPSDDWMTYTMSDPTDADLLAEERAYDEARDWESLVETCPEGLGQVGVVTVLERRRAA